MAAAARALGWPEQVVDTTREQPQNITKMQIETLDRMMDAWEEQIKSGDAMTASSAMLAKLKSLPSFGAAGSWPTADAWQKAGMNPLQLCTQLMGQWQKAWTDAMGFWVKAGMIQRVLTAAADERNQSNPKQAAIVPSRLELVLTAKSIDIEISRPTRLADLMGLQ